MRPFKLTAVGLGPGDPNLITIKGLTTIRAAQVVFVPRSKDNERSLAHRIAEPWLNHQPIVELALPMTRDSEQLQAAWQAAASQIVAAAQPDTNGVYLLLGDPLLYGTFTYIWRALADQAPEIDIEIIPGVTSFAAAAAQGQLPLGTTDDRLIIIPASYDIAPSRLQQLLNEFETVVFMKVGPVLPQMVSLLATMNLLETTLYAERVGMPEETIRRGSELVGLTEPKPYLSLLIVRNPRSIRE